MSFVLEEIPQEDIAQYGLQEINDAMVVVGFGNGWVIDRERNIYLRWIRFDLEYRSEMKFTFFWKGSLLELAIKSVLTGEGTTSRSIIWKMDYALILPAELEPHRIELLQDLRDALRAYKNFGVDSSSTRFEAKFEF